MPARRSAANASTKLHLSRARQIAILKALADPRRFALLEKIAKASCSLSCAQARAALPISAATLSHHIKELETAGLIKVERQGKFHYLSLRPGVLESVAANLKALETANCAGR
jgi:ArsR family transcriptional regulator, arsenate/arsenite/antimonite-responsive transcriptional repressor